MYLRSALTQCQRLTGSNSFTVSDELSIGLINNNPSYDFNPTINIYFGNDPLSNPYLENPIISKFYDANLMIDTFKNQNFPLFLSLNVQCLHSKFDQLNSFINQLSTAGLTIDAIAIQEIWQLPDPSIVQLSGFTLFYKLRSLTRGGARWILHQGLP